LGKLNIVPQWGTSSACCWDPEN